MDPEPTKNPDLEISPPQEIPQNQQKIFSWKQNFFLTRVLPITLGIIIFFFTTTVLYAYGIVPAINKDVQHKVSYFVQGISFMPKTPQYLLDNILKAHEGKTTGTIDGTITVSSFIISWLVGTSSVTANVTGAFDVTDPNNPLFSLSATTTKDLAIDILVKNSQVYFRLSKLPSTLSQNNPSLYTALLNKWFTIKTTPQQETSSKDKRDTATTIKETLTSLPLQELTNIITMDSDLFGLSPNYRFHITPRNQMVAELLKTSSITNASITISIDKKTFLITHGATLFTFQPKIDELIPLRLPTRITKTTIAMTSVITHLGEPVVIADTPENPTDFMEYLKTLSIK